MRIGVLWWTWRTWVLLRSTLLDAWHTVISLIRHPEKFITQNEKDTFIVGSATNQQDIISILKQVDILIDVTSVGFFHQSPSTLYSSVAQAIIDARPQWIASHLIVMSSAWTHHGRHLPWPTNWWYELFLWDVANDKEKAEALYQWSDLPRTYIKAPLLTNWTRSKYTTMPFSAYKPSLFDTISRKTIATCILDITEKNSFVQQKITPLVR